MEKLNNIVKNIKNQESYKNEYNYYGIRYHYTKKEIGSFIENSKIWIDGEPTDNNHGGVCAIDIDQMIVENFTISEMIENVKQYSYADGEIIIIAGNESIYGDDDNEIIIKNAIKIA